MHYTLKSVPFHFFQTADPEEWTSKVQTSKLKVVAFTLKSSQERNQRNLNITFEEYSYDAAIIHVGINDILRSKDSNDLNHLPENVIKAGKICPNHNIDKILISGIIPWTRTNVDISNINKKYANCLKITLNV